MRKTQKNLRKFAKFPETLKEAIQMIKDELPLGYLYCVKGTPKSNVELLHNGDSKELIPNLGVMMRNRFDISGEKGRALREDMNEKNPGKVSLLIIKNLWDDLQADDTWR